MNLDLFKKLKNEVHFQKDRKDAMRQRLIQFIEADKAVREGDFVRRTMQRSRMTAFFLQPVTMPIIVIVVIMALLGGGTSLAAQNALPGDFLYPVKIDMNEKIAAAFSLSAEAKATAEADFAEHRLEEAARLAHDSKLDAKTRAELQNNFEAHASNAKENISKVETEGNAAIAAGLASRFEGLLRADAAVLAHVDSEKSVKAKITDNGEADLSPLRTKVDDELNAVVKQKKEFESKVSEDATVSVEANAKAKTSAEGKINAAENVLEKTRAFIESQKAKLSADAVASAEARLRIADSDIADAKAKLQANLYGEAFNLANTAIRVAQEAKLLVNANSNLDIKVNIGSVEGDENNTKLELESSSTNNDQSGALRSDNERSRGSVEASSSMNVNVGGNGVKSEGSLNTKVGL